MFKTFKILWLEVRRDYHHRMVNRYDHKAGECRTVGKVGTFYDSKAWGHLYKELELNYKLHKLKGT